ncbi:trypsin-like serine peptidase [Clavibacter michiganensis]|uniref:trypsin-like serine peptidase n=1 Tax=Clavibacter michiganensis TaxID=28447 RepID=UPI003EB6BFCC
MIRPTAPSARRALLAASALIAATAAIAPGQPATASLRPATVVDQTSSVVTIPVAGTAADGAAGFWTPARREAARADDANAPSSDASADAVSADAADPVEQVAPVPHIGRLYFVRNGSYYYCTANVVDAPNGSTIATAGHCASSMGVFSTDLAFFPGAHDGQTPYGTWTIRTGNIPSGWYSSNDTDVADDSAFYALDANADGATVESVVGASPVLFGQSAEQAIAAFGYPVVGRFDGTHLERCLATGTALAPSLVAFPCGMTGGASGGPILAGSADGAQFANVTTLDYYQTHNQGPLWEDAQRSAYQATASDVG